MRDKLLDLILTGMYKHESTLENRFQPLSEFIADYLISNNVVRLPCKVGDTLYVISQTKDKRILPFVNEYEATHIQVGKRKCKVYHEQDGFIKIFLQDDFGKTVFLTRKEAEAKLKEGDKG